MSSLTKLVIMDASELEELKLLLDERLPRHALRAAKFKPRHRLSPESIETASRFWRIARNRVGLTQIQVAERISQRMGKKISRHEITVFEAGLVEPAQMTEEFLRAFAEALGHPRLVELFWNRFPQFKQEPHRP